MTQRRTQPLEDVYRVGGEWLDRGPVARYALAVVITAVALALTLLLSSVLEPGIFVFFYAAVTVSAWAGGFGPGMLTSILSVLAADYFFIAPLGSIGPEQPADYLTLAIFLIVTALTSTLCHQLRRERDRAAAAAREAEGARALAAAAADRTSRLQRVTAALAPAMTAQEVATLVLEHGMAAVGARAAVVALLDEEGRAFEVLGAAGFPPSMRRPLPRFTLAEGPMAADAVRTGEIVVLETPEAIRERYPALVPGMLTLGTQSLIAIPMRIDGRTAGVLVFNFDTPRTADESERRFLTAIAQQCAQALERARLYEAERVAREESERARAAADEANRAKTEFLTTMSHELRTPLNAIDGYAELLEMEIHGPVTDAQRGALQRIRRSQRHLLSLINDVLNFAKLEVGKVELHFEELAIRPLLQSVGELVEPQLRAKGLTYECHAGDARVHAWADREKLQQIVLNLLSNAIKFTAPGGRVELSADATEDLVLVHVADTGRGIPAEMLQAIFEPFVQVRRSLHTTAEGTGLGLAISRDLARAMDGDLTVESAEGRGSRFTVELRRIDRTLEPRLTPAQAAAPELPRDR